MNKSDRRERQRNTQVDSEREAHAHRDAASDCSEDAHAATPEDYANTNRAHRLTNGKCHDAKDSGRGYEQNDAGSTWAIRLFGLAFMAFA